MVKSIFCMREVYLCFYYSKIRFLFQNARKERNYMIRMKFRIWKKWKFGIWEGERGWERERAREREGEGEGERGRGRGILLKEKRIFNMQMNADTMVKICTFCRSGIHFFFEKSQPVFIITFIFIGIQFYAIRFYAIQFHAIQFYFYATQLDTNNANNYHNKLK